MKEDIANGSEEIKEIEEKFREVFQVRVSRKEIA